ncbi:Pro-kumamolisin, activation domain-containing protein [Lactarius quietus]|nr:Pro-kumamolisin, activation domain-containing protein [Lactarius quietus]
MQLHQRRVGYNGPAPENAALRFRIALIQNDREGLQTKPMGISTPSSPSTANGCPRSRRQHQVGTFVIPKPETVTAVNEWLSGNGLNATVLSPFGDWMSFEMTVSREKELLDAEFSTFVHDGSGKSIIRTLAYSIPTSLKDHLEAVHPAIISSKKIGRARNITSAVAPCDAEMTPICLQQLYGIPGTSASQSTNTLAVTGYLEEFANGADLKQLPDWHRGSQKNLDVQYTVGMASPTFFISVGDDFEDGDLEGFLDNVNVLQSKSDERTVSPTLANTLFNESTAYADLGARGVSILFASGDCGVSGSQSRSCAGRRGPFIPIFPSGCPLFVFLPCGNPSSVTLTFFPQTKRFPDIAAAGTNCVIIESRIVIGTSCSSPIFASVENVLCFLNPFLYSTGASALNDIKIGSNPRCDTDGFPATAGWDPVTGLGTPNWVNLLASVGL